MIDVKKNFTYHPPKEHEKHVYEAIRRSASECANYLQIMLPSSRELSITITKIEEAVMWANAAVARNGLCDPEEAWAKGNPDEGQ